MNYSHRKSLKETNQGNIMSRSSGNPDHEESEEYLRIASDSMRDAVPELGRAVKYTVKGFRIRSREHPVLRGMVVALISSIFVKFAFRVFGVFYTTFYGNNVVVSTDLRVQTLPFPIGLSIYLLFTLWLLTTFSVYLRLADMREKIEQLESEKKMGEISH